MPCFNKLSSYISQHLTNPAVFCYPALKFPQEVSSKLRVISDMTKLTLFLVFATIVIIYAHAGVLQNISNDQDRAPKIAGGEVSPLGAFPHQVSVYHSGQFFCSGSIISSQAVVTGAHCCIGDSYSLSIRAGLNDIVSPESGFQTIAVSEAIIHPSYDDSKMLNDICILRLAKPLILSIETRTATIKLPDQGYRATGKAIVSGWGETLEAQPSNLLMNVTVPIITDEECRQLYNESLIIDDSMICVGEKGKGPCQGDYGGPMVDSQEILVGIVLRGKGCAQEYFPSVNTEVSAYVQWIKEVTSRFQ